MPPLDINVLTDLVCWHFFNALYKAKKTYSRLTMTEYAFSKGILHLSKEVGEKFIFWDVLADIRLWLESRAIDDPDPTRADYCAFMEKRCNFDYDPTTNEFIGLKNTGNQT